MNQLFHVDVHSKRPLYHTAQYRTVITVPLVVEKKALKIFLLVEQKSKSPETFITIALFFWFVFLLKSEVRARTYGQNATYYTAFESQSMSTFVVVTY